MNNINSITALITSLRSETQERSITPERVGNLFQQLANLLAHCTTDTEFNPIYENAVLNIRSAVSRTANTLTINLTLLDSLETDTPVNISIPMASNSQAGLISATDYAAIMAAISGGGSGSGSGMTEEERTKLNTLASHFVRLGDEGDVWRSSQSAEDEAKKLVYCGNPDIWFMYYYVQGSKYGFIEQHVCDDTCIQTLHWDNGISRRIITFTNTDRTAISNVGAWTAMGNTTAAEVTKLQNLPDAATILADNFGIRFLGHVGNASATGENTAASLELAGYTKIIWIIYTYSSYTAMIHQTHNGTTTVQDMYFAGSRLSRRTITFTNANRTAISSVGSWTAVGTDIGVTRSDTSATIKIPHPFMEKTAGLLTLVIGQANATYAGLMTKENLRTLNYLDETMETMFTDVVDLKNAVTLLQSSVQGLQEYVNNLSEYFVLKPYLEVSTVQYVINIPVWSSGTNAGKIKTTTTQTIWFTAYDENQQQVDVMDCSISWVFEHNENNAFFIDYEGGKRYVEFTADEGETWPSSSYEIMITFTLTNLNNQTNGTCVVTLRRNNVTS